MTKADKEGQRKAPILRFKGFTDAWEQRKLQNQVQFFSGLTYSPSDVKDVGTFVIRSSNIKDNTLISADNVYVNPNIANSEPVKKDDVIMVVRNGSKSLIGKHALVTRKIDNTVIGAFMTGIRSSTPYFLDALLDTINFKKEIYKNLGATINQITIGNLRKMTFKVPNESEKFKIGNLFKKLNYLLALYERKIKALKKLKQAIFEVLNSIPHKSNVYRISEIFDVTRGNVLSKKSISNKFSNMYPVYSSQTKNDGLLGYYSDYLFENSITWTTDGANAGTVKYRTGKFYCTNVCGVLLNSEGYCNEYTAEVIEKETPKFVSHVGNPKLMNNVMKQIKIKLPDVATQQSYSDILLTFDNVCTSFCNKLNDLNQIKNKLLNTMFI
ncbi:restriction endonuclease subunit S [Ligilactobacillus aviarius]|uniref:restriction endonuclease subunit S n=1 Tax=Ligilactobacillus aviarius TaxID=1606 RepID=UPI0025A47990|nr:restriction endonuclease subunit S [Ligilactobacillus aviarius]MDM8278571.1 restriction endonuclease subunit S [Ligilactobacillus aviarius]